MAQVLVLEEAAPGLVDVRGGLDGVDFDHRPEQLGDLGNGGIRSQQPLIPLQRSEEVSVLADHEKHAHRQVSVECGQPLRALVQADDQEVGIDVEADGGHGVSPRAAGGAPQRASSVPAPDGGAGPRRQPTGPAAGPDRGG